MSEARQILKIAEMEQKLVKEAGVNFCNDERSGRRALNATGAVMDSVDFLYGDEEAQRRGARGLAGRAYKNGEAVVDVIDVFSDDPRRRAQGAKGLAAAAGGHAATMAMNQGTNLACREAGKFALGEATKMAVNEGGRRGAIVATGRGAAMAAGARGAAAGAGNIGKVAGGATGFAVGAATVVGQIGGEAVGSALGKALGDEQAGKTIGGLGGSMGSAALAGACVGGPIGAATAAGVAYISYGVSKGVEAVVTVIGRCFEGGYFPTNARQVFGKDCGHCWDLAKNRALEEIAKDPERRVAVTTYWAVTGFHVRIYEAVPGQPMKFERKDGIHDLLRNETRFLWTALASGRYMQAHRDGSLKQRELFGGDWEAFRIFPVYGLEEERYAIKTCHNTYLMVDEDGNVRQTQACSDISGTYAHTAGSSLVTLTQNGFSGTSHAEGWSYTVSGSTATIHGHGVTGQIIGSAGSYKIIWTNGITYTQATAPCVISSGDSVFLQAETERHGYEYIEVCGRAGGGYGVSTRATKEAAAQFYIYKWSGESGQICSGDSVYLQAATHGNEYVEICARAGAGYGVSTRATKSAAAQLYIYKWSGKSGQIGSSDSVYLQAATHGNEYVEICARAGAGYGVSTRATKSAAAQLNIQTWISCQAEATASHPAATDAACQFAIIPCDGGIAFRSCSGSYLSARKEGCFNTQRRLGEREQFTWVDLENGYMALRIPDVRDSPPDFDYEEHQRIMRDYYEEIAPLEP